MRAIPATRRFGRPAFLPRRPVFPVYTDTKTQKHAHYNTPNYLVWTDDIRGEWSDLPNFNSTGFDPPSSTTGIKSTLVNMRNGFRGILLQEYDHEKRA